MIELTPRGLESLIDLSVAVRELGHMASENHSMSRCAGVIDAANIAIAALYDVAEAAGAPVRERSDV